MIEKGGGRGSGRSALVARHDHDDDDDITKCMWIVKDNVYSTYHTHTFVSYIHVTLIA